MAPLIHLIYTSVAKRAFSSTELEALLEKSRTANERANLTGMLLYSEGNFFQVVEGSREEIDKLHARLVADSRHAQLTVIVKEPIAKRSFGSWSMGFSSATPEELARIPGFNDFFQAGSCLQNLDHGRAKKLLEAFAKGRWRSRLLGAA